jgi:hypothetical protein
MYKAIVTRLKNVRAHSNADRVKLATCVGNQVVIGLDHEEDELGIYFGSDGQLSHEFCKANNLYRDSLMNVDPSAKPGMFDNNRRVRAQRFRGEISDGFWVPISYFDFLGKFNFQEGEEFSELKNVLICNKYINPATAKAASRNNGRTTRKAKTSVMFKEHFDTEQFGKNLQFFKKGQTIVITEKLHGTSGRVGRVKVERDDFTLMEKIAKFFGARIEKEEWKYLNGTRRVVLEESNGTQYHDPGIREYAFKVFDGNLRKGETVFFEIVGFEPNGLPIMPPGDVNSLKDKDFSKKYGEKMMYSYGCDPEKCEVYVYRITFTNEDGQTIDYAWEDVVSRCHEMGVKTVPHIATLRLEDVEMNLMLRNKSSEKVDDRDVSEKFFEMVQEWGSGVSILDNRHIREGVCVRIEGGISNRTYKFKSFEFKVLEGIAKDSGVVDEEEAQG